jgi:Flp pilus assembly protein TadB
MKTFLAVFLAILAAFAVILAVIGSYSCYERRSAARDKAERIKTEVLGLAAGCAALAPDDRYDLVRTLDARADAHEAALIEAGEDSNQAFMAYQALQNQFWAQGCNTSEAVDRLRRRRK